MSVYRALQLIDQKLTQLSMFYENLRYYAIQ